MSDFFSYPLQKTPWVVSQTSEKVDMFNNGWNGETSPSFLQGDLFTSRFFFGKVSPNLTFFFRWVANHHGQQSVAWKQIHYRRLCIFRGPASNIDFMFFFSGGEQGFRRWAIFSRAPLGGSSQLVRGEQPWIVCPLTGVVPLPFMAFLWLIQGGDPNHASKSWDDPPTQGVAE